MWGKKIYIRLHQKIRGKCKLPLHSIFPRIFFKYPQTHIQKKKKNPDKISFMFSDFSASKPCPVSCRFLRLGMTTTGPPVPTPGVNCNFPTTKNLLRDQLLTQMPPLLKFFSGQSGNLILLLLTLHPAHRALCSAYLVCTTGFLRQQRPVLQFNQGVHRAGMGGCSVYFKTLCLWSHVVPNLAIPVIS